jgi:hypothetical protein
MHKRVVSYLVAGIPTVVVFAIVSKLYGLPTGLLSYVVGIIVGGELIIRAQKEK